MMLRKMKEVETGSITIGSGAEMPGTLHLEIHQMGGRRTGVAILIYHTYRDVCQVLTVCLQDSRTVHC